MPKSALSHEHPPLLPLSIYFNYYSYSYSIIYAFLINHFRILTVRISPNNKESLTTCMAIILTNCTSRKRASKCQALSLDSIPPGKLDDVAVQWKNLLMHSKGERAAVDIYCGRSFREAERCSLHLNAPFYVVSAGLGIIKSTTSIPLYNLTVAPGTSASISDKVPAGYSIEKWWSVITDNNPYGTTLLEIIEKHPQDLFLLSLSRPYINLIYSELESLPECVHPRLRFFGKNTIDALPLNLRGNWMPYDDRLENAGKGFSGTQSDFAQRALKHFVHQILLEYPNATAKEHGILISIALSKIGSSEKDKMKGIKLNDNEIRILIQKHWEINKFSSTALLGYFRNTLGIACEQSRFHNIYRSIQQS